MYGNDAIEESQPAQNGRGSSERHDGLATSVKGRFVTLENFILDTFTRVDEDGIERALDKPDEIGGAGTYTLIGARIFLPASKIGMIIDYTPETFPAELKSKLDRYGPEAFVFRLRTDGHPTLRAVNRYQGQLRIFEYLSTPRFLTPRDWAGTSLEHPPPGVLHFVPMRDRLAQVVEEIEAHRTRLARERWDPAVIWEPDIPACVPQNLDLFRQIAPKTHVISPNHSEALALLSMSPAVEVEPSRLRDHLAAACVSLAVLRPRIAVIIRCGPMGSCYIETSSRPDPCIGDARWVPAYWDPTWSESENRVVDPTGAGNGFMGGLGAALEVGKDIHEGWRTTVLWATVSASFIIEQDGLPRLEHTSDGEIWNGERPLDRVARLRQRVH